jgi:hypothetical protein
VAGLRRGLLWAEVFRDADDLKASRRDLETIAKPLWVPAVPEQKVCAALAASTRQRERRGLGDDRGRRRGRLGRLILAVALWRLTGTPLEALLTGQLAAVPSPGGAS